MSGSMRTACKCDWAQHECDACKRTVAPVLPGWSSTQKREDPQCEDRVDVSLLLHDAPPAAQVL
jgi:hypothetical protein